MNNRIWMTLAALLVHGSSSVATEPVYVWTQPPGERQNQEWIADNARRLAIQYSRHAETWAAQKDLEFSFVVTSRTDFVPGACDEIPIRVTIRPNLPVVLNALDASPTCDAKIVEKMSSAGDLLLTPDAMFRRIKDSIRTMKSRGSDCIQAAFDAATGIPTQLQGGCPGKDDDGWRVAVSEIRRKASAGKPAEPKRGS